MSRAKEKLERGRHWDSPEYIAFCAAQSKQVKIRYVDTTTWYTAQFIHTYRRSDFEISRGPVMSASSGPKDYLVNDIVSIFGDEQVDAVTLLRLGGALFVVVRKDGKLFDYGKQGIGRRVEMLWERKAAT